MVRLSHILSIATLVVHLVVGCCAHHARACEGRHAVWAAYYGAVRTGQCPDCQCDPWRRGSGERQDRKYFLASPRRPAGDSFSPPFQAPCGVVADFRFSPLAHGLYREFRTTGHLPPVRLHLVNQVLLI